MGQTDLARIMAQAMQEHQAGHLAQAEALYRRILGQDPNQNDAWHLLGVVAHRSQRDALAVDLIRRAIALRPDQPSYHSDLGEAHRALGQVDEAIGCYLRALFFKPDWAEVHNNLGNLLREKDQLDDAIACYEQAVAFKMDYPEAHANLGAAMLAQGRTDEAIGCCQQAVRLKPDWPDAHHGLGNALANKERWPEAIACYRQALALRPDWAEAHNNLGATLADICEFEQAIACYRQALALDGGVAEFHNNLGNALARLGNLEEALVCYRRALELKEDYAEAHNNLAALLAEQGQHEQALARYRHALELKPDWAELHTNLGQALLLQGELLQGWKEQEWRWQARRLAARPRSFPQPLWDGSALAGRKLLLHAEQGFGDTLQFIRYVPLAVARAARAADVTVECPPELCRLLQTLPGTIQWVIRGQPLPTFDVHAPLLSLPRAFATTLDTVPSQVPYLHADEQISRHWQERLAGDTGELKIGLAWAGNPRHTNDRNRSTTLATLAPLAQVKGVRFYSLQKGAAASQAQHPPAGVQLTDWTAELKDYADTAGLIANLDLVICVDTSMAHLAGALGKPVWTMLPFMPEWRWLLEREDTPWYPTMRLFRQKERGDWSGVVRRIVEALAMVRTENRTGLIV